MDPVLLSVYSYAVHLLPPDRRLLLSVRINMTGGVHRNHPANIEPVTNMRRFIQHENINIKLNQFKVHITDKTKCLILMNVPYAMNN